MIIEKNEEKFEPVDFDLWALCIRKKRREKGFEKARDFVIYLQFQTRTKLNLQSYYKIEQGKQEPTLTQFMAINLVLFGDFQPSNEIMQLCISEKWKTVKDKINRQTDSTFGHERLVPEDWAVENLESLNELYKQDSDDERPENASTHTKASKFNLPEGLFAEPIPF